MFRRLLLGAWLLLVGCPLEPLRVTSYHPTSPLLPGSVGSAQVTVRVPGLKAQDANGLQAMVNGTPVPIVSTADGELVIRLPPGMSGEQALFELWRNGEQLVRRDIAAQIAQGVGVNDPAITAKTLDSPPAVTGSDRSPLIGDIIITVTVPSGSAVTGAPVVISGVTGTGSSGTTASPTPSPSPTPEPTPTPTPTPTPSPTPSPSATLVPIADQTPVPPGTGEVQGDVAF